MSLRERSVVNGQCNTGGFDTITSRDSTSVPGVGSAQPRAPSGSAISCPPGAVLVNGQCNSGGFDTVKAVGTSVAGCRQCATKPIGRQSLLAASTHLREPYRLVQSLASQRRATSPRAREIAGFFVAGSRPQIPPACLPTNSSPPTKGFSKEQAATRDIAGVIRNSSSRAVARFLHYELEPP